MIQIQRALLVLLCALSFVGCSRNANEPSAAESTADPEITNRIEIPATVRNNLGITFASVERRRVDSTIRIPGAFELQPLARHEYRMTLSGHVSLAVDQYQSVRPGDLLYRFRSPQWPELQREIMTGEQDIEAAASEIEVARARIEETESRLKLLKKRLAELAEAEFRSADLEAQAAELEFSLPRMRAELKQAETKLTNAKRTREHSLQRASAATGIAEVDLSRLVDHAGESMPAYRTIDWIEVKAIESGVVESMGVTDGAFSEAPTIVLSTIDPSNVRFRAMALQTDLARLQGSLTARIAPPSVPGIPIEDAVDASVFFGLEAHPEQRTVTLLARPSEMRPWIRPGVSAFLEVVTDSTTGPALAIPRASIVKDGIVHVYFRRDPSDPNKAIRVEADMGVTDGRWVAINSGLSLTDQVVLNGAYELKLASQQSGLSQKGGHFHADGTFHGEH